MHDNLEKHYQIIFEQCVCQMKLLMKLFYLKHFSQCLAKTLRFLTKYQEEHLTALIPAVNVCPWSVTTSYVPYCLPNFQVPLVRKVLQEPSCFNKFSATWS